MSPLRSGWWHAHNDGGALVQRYYAFAREVEKNIGNPKAAFTGHIIKFQALIPLDDSIEGQLDTISDLTQALLKKL